METIMIHLKEDQQIEFSNGVIIDGKILNKLKTFQLGYDDNNPVDGEEIEDLKRCLIEVGDFIHKLSFDNNLDQTEVFLCIESLYHARAALECFKKPIG